MRVEIPGKVKIRAEESTFSGSVAATSVASTGSIGYATGAGGAVTQGTSKATGVTLSKLCGAITMHAAELAAAAEVGFTLTNTLIAATDVVVVNIKSGATANAYQVSVDAVAAGSCHIVVANLSAGALSEALVLNFAVIKAVAA
jgi:hypothetical protein